MSYRLFPQLPRNVAESLAAEYASLGVAELRLRAANHHPAQIFSPTGGQQMASAELDELAADVRKICEGAPPSGADHQLAQTVHSRMRITRSEAALEGVWSFLGCMLLPDVVRWRFHGASTPPDRFVGANRGVRNVIGRAWWRGELLFDEAPPNGRDPYWLVGELGEDELTGIVERQRAIASRRVGVALARGLLATEHKGLARNEVARDAFKLFLRLGYFVEFDGLTDEELQVASQSICRRSVMTLREAARG